ncbi:MAG: sigma-70 family RNA polymerase sigma factor [Planctomycetaceae bacterium]|nr:sigma-70 family RNA polymerase sigma factor [Planctomycetaceae bacterium]
MSGSPRDALVRDFRQLWDGPQPPGLGEFVVARGVEEPSLLTELALIDLEQRVARGESVQAEQYFDRFPAIAADPQLAGKLIAAEYDLIAEQLPAGVESAGRAIESRAFPPNLLDSTSTRLLRRAAAGESRAWELLVRVYGPVVRYWCRRAGLNKTDVADTFSETFLAVVRSLPKFEKQAGKAKFRAWLKTVTLSKVNNHFNKQGKQPAALGGSTAMMQLAEVADDPEWNAALEQSAAADNDEALAHSEEAFLAQRMVQLVRSEFRDQTWQAFYRTAVEQCTSQQAAEELGMSAMAVRKAKSRVMQRLKELLGGDEQA